MTTEHLPDGGAMVTLGDDPVWTPLDVFTWVAFGERREGSGGLPCVLLPRGRWSRDWGQALPGQGVLDALAEVESGVHWQPAPGGDEEATYFECGYRAWARNIMERTGERAPELARALAADRERYRLAEVDYLNAKADVKAAIRDGRLQVWARRAHGAARPNHEAEPELLGPRWFTHQPREVEEAGWVQGPGDYKGPWWDEARFNAEQVLALWPVGGGIGTFANMPCPFPEAERIAPWVAASWRAFGTLDTPGHVISHRSFDGGTDHLPDETKAEYAARQEDHRLFDAAEREVMDLLASGRINAKGQPPAEGAPHEAEPGGHVDVPADALLDRQLAFDPHGKLIVRLDTPGRLFPPLAVRGTKASPEYPLWHGLLIEAAGLRGAWGLAGTADLLPAPKQPSSPTADTPAPAPRKRKHTGQDWRTDDAPLVEEMRRMIDAGEAPSATNAALAVVGQAKGAGKPDSKVARLVKLYGKTHPVV